MGNELSTQAVQAQTPAQKPAQTSAYNNFGNNGASNALFNFGMNGKNYSNDFIMPDYLKTGNITDEQRASIFGNSYDTAQPTNFQAQQYPTTTELTQAEKEFSGKCTQKELEEYYNNLLAKNPNLRMTEKGNIYEVSSAGKKTGILTGIGAALASGIVKLCKGEALAKAFSLKGLAIKLPIFAVAGWAIGSVIDAFANSSSAKQADSIA